MPTQALDDLFPSYNEVAEALLQLLAANGGQLRSSETYAPLAEHFNLSARARTVPRSEYFKDNDRTEPAWHTIVQFGRRTLNTDGFLESSTTGVWKLSRQGIDHATRARGGALGPPLVGGPRESLGTNYRLADENRHSPDRRPFDTDPNAIDRGNIGHSKTQNSLAAFLRERGIEPRSPAADEPDYDLGWQAAPFSYVAEVKSITPANEERQLRLGLGQVLRYQQQMAARGATVRAVLVPEKEPSDKSWHSLCSMLGVLLTWPTAFANLIQTTSAEPTPPPSRFRPERSKKTY